MEKDTGFGGFILKLLAELYVPKAGRIPSSKIPRERGLPCLRFLLTKTEAEIVARSIGVPVNGDRKPLGVVPV